MVRYYIRRCFYEKESGFMNPRKNMNVEVTMFGEFSITINGNQITGLTGHTKRVWLLIQYLLANRQQAVPIDTITEALWENNECSDPKNALKNLVYRARELLKEIYDNKNVDYIERTLGTYRWNNAIHCTIDSEQFVAQWKLGNDSMNSELDRIDAYEKAIALYRGEFLIKSSYSSWVVALDSYYSTIYFNCVINVCELLIAMNSYGRVIRIGEMALTYAPMEETIHKMLLQAYVVTGQRNKAFDHYNAYVNLCYKEQGTDVPQVIHQYYHELVNRIEQIEPDLFAIKNDLKEAESAVGAYFCDYDVFKSIYRVQARSIKRFGQSVFLVLFTLSNPAGEIPQHEVAQHSTSCLKSSITENLRKGDVVASFSATQFVVMLPLESYEDAEKVTKRILTKFRFSYRKSDIKITHRINAIDSVE